MGPWTIAAVIAVLALVTESGRAGAKKAFRAGIRAGYHAKESAVELADKAKVYKEDLIAEIKADAEDNDEDSHEHKAKKKAKTATH
jgi:hypothetical protein